MIQQLTVYALVKDLDLFQNIERAAKECCSSADVKKETDVLLHVQWVQEGSKLFFKDSESVPFMDRLVVLITDHLDIRSGLVAYALYKEMMPVLSLKVDATLSDENDRIAAALYSAPVKEKGITAEVAIANFFNFLNPPGQLIVLEGSNPSSVLAQGRALVEKLGAGAVLLGSAGSDLEGDGEEEEIERSHFADVIQRAYDHIKNKSLDEDSVRSIGAISVANRHRNLPILRYRFQRGINAVLCRPRSVIIEKILCCCEESQMNSEEVDTLLKNMIERMGCFEYQMMDMPKPSLVLCLNDTNAVVSSLNNYIGGREIHLQASAEQLDPAVWEAVSGMLIK